MASRTGAKNVELPVDTEVIERIPLFKFVLLIKRVVAVFGSKMARNLYSAFNMFPFLQQLKFEAGLKLLSCSWGATAPRYHNFYAVIPLLEEHGEGPETQSSFGTTFLLPIQRH